MSAAVEEGIHPTAIISRKAELGGNVSVGPYAIIGDGCAIGDGCTVAPHAVLERNVHLARNVRVGVGSVLGGDPQDLKFKGEETTVEIGEGSVIREYATINRGTAESMKTTVGRGCFIMSYVHLAHDCHIGDGVIISNNSQLAGHVTVDEKAIISGLVGFHQFTQVGRFSFVGGMSRVAKDVPPYVKAVGNPIKLYGLNTVGLERNGFAEDTIRELKRAYRLFFKSELNVSQARERAETELKHIPEVVEFLRFFERSERGAII
jgi:UDP-N-acetylglucosamine acyltransferase